ncbi:MAG TPA: hypothetical protein VGK74_18730 [Symbiobacteriaceae bacterium]|jgi:hypothetical protein
MEHSERELAALGGEHRLTESELINLRHALDSEILGLKKCLHYAQEVGDDQARRLFREHADIHHRRVDMMLALLDAPGDITKQAKYLLQTAHAQTGGHTYA